MKLNFIILISSLLAFSILIQASEPVTVTLEAVRNNTIFSEANNSNGKGSHLFAGRTNNGSLRRALLAFDINQSIPEGAVIQEVSLSMRMNRTIVGSVSVSLHRLDRNWGEGNSNAAGEEGMGAAAQAGDATWNHAFFTDTPWSNAGGDFQNTASATTSVASLGLYSWSSQGMIGDVQSWLDEPDTDFGWILLAPEGVATTAKRFDSRHAAITSNRPRLTITYILEEQLPEPIPSFWVDSTEVINGWRYSGQGYDDIAGIGWIYDPNFPWIFTFAHGDESGEWVYVHMEGGDYQNFYGFRPNKNYWFFANASAGEYYSFAPGEEGWFPYRLN